MPIPEEKAHGYVASQVGTLLVAHTLVQSPMSTVRAASWYQAMARLGLHLPLCIVHDLGHLFTTPRGPGGLSLGPRAELGAVPLDDEARAALRQYEALLAAVAESEVVQQAAAWHVRDELVAVLLARVTQDLYQRWPDPAKGVGAEPLPLDPNLYADADLVRHFRDFDRAPLFQFLRFAVGQRLRLLGAVEQIDLDTLRLLGLFREDGGGAEPIDLADLYQAFASPQANDVVSFSLELLPSILETKRQSGVQAFSADGYAAVERHGSVDTLILSEIALDEDLFDRKVVDDELYYYGHERQREEERSLEILLVDASASMRGVREVFARGLALALVKKLLLRGDDVVVRFFDSRLYEPMRAAHGGGFSVAGVLSFRSERGRNYARVFQQLAGEVERIRREQRRQVVLYLLTHGECHVPVELVQRLRRVAYLYGIFLLPSRRVRLDYLGELHRHQVVTAEALSSRRRRVDRAREIVVDATERPAAGAAAGRPGEDMERGG